MKINFLSCWGGRFRRDRKFSEPETLYGGGGGASRRSEGLILSDDIRMGMLLLVTHFYENRSTVTEVEKVELPMSFNWLVGPYRYIPL